MGWGLNISKIVWGDVRIFKQLNFFFSNLANARWVFVVILAVGC
jgi:hypothetical protein